MAFLAIVASAASFVHVQSAPVLWLRTDGQLLVNGQKIEPKVRPGSQLLRMNGAAVWDFNGSNGGLLLEDMPALRLTGSITVSTWIKLRSYVNYGPGAQVLFRGDDRGGLDPYSMVVLSDGSIHFSIQGENRRGRAATAEIPLGSWCHVLGNFDCETGKLEMWFNGDLVGTAKTSLRPFANLDPSWTPGVSIGNVQNDTGIHNQPVDGRVTDLRLYDRVLRPADLDILGGRWFEPPKSFGQ